MPDDVKCPTCGKAARRPLWVQLLWSALTGLLSAGVILKYLDHNLAAPLDGRGRFGLWLLLTGAALWNYHTLTYEPPAPAEEPAKT